MSAPTGIRREPRIAVDSREQLLYLLAEAAEIEHGLMCCYLFAAFSLKRATTEDLAERELDAVERWRRAILQVAREEMLHLSLVANLTTALGGSAHFARPNFPVPAGFHPSGVILTLAPLTRETLQHFLYLERPEGIDVEDGRITAPAATYVRETVLGKSMPSAQDYLTVGHLYRAIADGLKASVSRTSERAVFIGDPEAQMTAQIVSLPELCAVRNLDEALNAINTIVRQGEGSSVASRESHYGRFMSMAEEFDRLREARPAFVPHRPVATSPVMRKPPDPKGKVHVDAAGAAAVLDLANSVYGLMLRTLAQAFGRPGSADAKRLLVDTSTDLMYVISPLAELLTTLPASSNHPASAGMTFAMLRDVASVPHGPGEWALVQERLDELKECATHLEADGLGVDDAARILTSTARKFGQRVALLHDDKPVPAAATIGKPRDMPSASTVATVETGVANGVETATGQGVTLQFDSRRCIHSRFCVLGLPRVYKANVKGPWLDPDAATVEANIGVAHNCPSGAIHYVRHDGGPEEPAPEVNLVTLRENGPYAFRAPLVIDGNVVGYRATLCRCGASRNKPFCDGSHVAVGFAVTGEPATGEFQPLAERAGPLNIAPRRNGPLAVSGNLEILSGTGRTIMKATSTLLCRCGHSGNKPFCDGTHSKIGFTAP